MKVKVDLESLFFSSNFFCAGLWTAHIYFPNLSKQKP